VGVGADADTMRASLGLGTMHTEHVFSLIPFLFSQHLQTHCSFPVETVAAVPKGELELPLPKTELLAPVATVFPKVRPLLLLLLVASDALFFFMRGGFRRISLSLLCCRQNEADVAHQFR